MITKCLPFLFHTMARIPSNTHFEVSELHFLIAVRLVTRRTADLPIKDYALSSLQSSLTLLGIAIRLISRGAADFPVKHNTLSDLQNSISFEFLVGVTICLIA